MMKRQLLSLALVTLVSVAAPAADLPVAVESIPACSIASRTYTGSYEQHPAAVKALYDLAAGKQLAAPRIIGIYPTDPDAVKPEDLHWELGVVIRQDQVKAMRGERSVTVKSLPATQAVVVESTVARAAADGLAIIRWMADHGYAQTAPTRMVYGQPAADPMKTSATIIVPAVRRARRIAS